MSSHPPIITLEVRQMKHTVSAMLAEHTAMLDAEVQRALDEALTPERISAVVRSTVNACVTEAVSEEIRSFFKQSRKGRVAIREAVQEYMEQHFGDPAP